ncbi:MAG: hypothetical protein JWP83_573, partial [Mycobacterium sp.]|nr:hypothetical protein [Mycobacterium sp.]
MSRRRGAAPLGVLLAGGAVAGGVPVSVTVGGGDCTFSVRELMTMITAIKIASAPSTPAAHSSARWPEENVRRAGARGRPVDGPERRGAMLRLGPTAGDLVCGLDGMA